MITGLKSLTSVVSEHCEKVQEEVENENVKTNSHDPNFLKKFLNRRLQNKSPDMIIESETFEVNEPAEDSFKELIKKDSDAKELLKDAFIPVQLVSADDPRSVMKLRIQGCTI